MRASTNMKKMLKITWLMLICGTAHGQDRAAAQWLERVLDGYFADSLSMQQIVTARYAQFKTDAMNVDFNGGMGRAAFAKKWGSSYNIHQQYLYEGFLIPLQDWDRVTVQCHPLPMHQGQLWIAADITQQPSGEYFHRDIRLVKANDGWRIDDVMEVGPLQAFITGDFDGDKGIDTLRASLTGSISGKPILVDTLMDYDSLVAITVRQKPLLQLKAKGLASLLLNEGNDYVLGLALMQNIGNTDGVPGNEIAVVIQGADWSGSNVYRVYSYRGRKWKLIRAIEIKEEVLPLLRAGKLKP